MGKAVLSKAEKLRLEADLLEAEEKLSAVKPERKVCGECGQRIPWTAAERKKVKAAAVRVHELRLRLRQAREAE